MNSAPRKADSLGARIACAPALQSLYARVRQIPLLGGVLHKLAVNVLPSGTRVVTRVREGRGEGLLLSVDPRYEASYAAGFHEAALVEFLVAQLEPGDVFYDVGGHIGFISMVGARVVGTAGTVFVFEADPENAARILGHLQMNSLPQIEIVRAAAWSECKTLSFHRAPGASSRNTGSVAEAEGSGNSGNLIRVDAVTLDSFAAGHRAPAVVKIDVEGAEDEVLKGAEKLFRQSKPVLVCEVHHARAAENVHGWLATLGYQWKWLDNATQFPRHLVAQPNP